VIIIRGLPGAGKSYLAKLIKDKEAKHQAPPPRILALDDYFMQETEKTMKLPGQKRIETVRQHEYVYEKEMEPAYRASLLKTFNKTLDEGFFNMVIVDAINNRNRHYDQFWSDAKHKGFEVYIAELTGDVSVCTERNIHKRTKDELEDMLLTWEVAPVYYKRIDVSSMLQDDAIEDVEMDEAAEETEVSADKSAEDEEEDEDIPTTFHIPKSRWETDKEETLAKLDGMMKPRERKPVDPIFPEDDEEDDPYDDKETDMRLGKKRVRWLDIEQKKQDDHHRKIGFVIGQGWDALTNPNAVVPK
jgi:YLP motif-containing protein 1